MAAEVRDILIRPPEDEPYDTLKEVLTRCTTLSESKRLEQLLSAEELGDRKPTQLRRRMQQLLGDKSPLMDNKLLTQLFIQRLPPSIRVVLANSIDGIKLDALSQLADKMVEAAGPTTLVQAVHNQPTIASATDASPQDTSYSVLHSEVMELRQDMAEIKGTLAELRLDRSTPRRGRNRGHDYSPRGRPRSHSSRRSPSNVRTGSNLASGTMCWYHTNFGTSVERCNQPCSFQGNSQVGH